MIVAARDAVVDEFYQASRPVIAMGIRCGGVPVAERHAVAGIVGVGAGVVVRRGVGQHAAEDIVGVGVVIAVRADRFPDKQSIRRRPCEALALLTLLTRAYPIREPLHSVKKIMQTLKIYVT